MTRHAASTNAKINRRVFVNFPFEHDAAHLQLLHAIVFAIHDCGFEARTALQDAGSGESRIDKIAAYILESRYSIHELSRIDDDSAAPRLNMAFECGMAYGARVFGQAGRGPAHDFLGLARERSKALSDLDGKDFAYHDGKFELAIKGVRLFLSAKADQLGFEVRDHADIVDRFARFEVELPETVEKTRRFAMKSIGTLDYLREWTNLAAVWLAADAQRNA